MLRRESFNTSGEPWNKGKLVGQKPPLELKEIWSIRIRLQLASKLRGCDLLKLRLNNVEHGGRVMSRAIILQQKTQKPVQFEITSQTRNPSCSGAMQSAFVLAIFCSRVD